MKTMVNKMVKVNGKDIWRIKLLKKLKKFTRKETIKKNDILSNDICEIFTEICK